MPTAERGNLLCALPSRDRVAKGKVGVDFHIGKIIVSTCAIGEAGMFCVVFLK